jgi:hypothetical protein
MTTTQEPCSFCGGTADRPGAVALEFSTFPHEEVACQPTHADLLVKTRTLGFLVRWSPLTPTRSAA